MHSGGVAVTVDTPILAGRVLGRGRRSGGRGVAATASSAELEGRRKVRSGAIAKGDVGRAGTRNRGIRRASGRARVGELKAPSSRYSKRGGCYATIGTRRETKNEEPVGVA